MPITLGGAAPGNIVRLNRDGQPVNFYVHAHGLDRTTLVQELVESGTYRPGNPEDGYLGGGNADAYLNGQYVAAFDPQVIAVLPTEIQYEYYISTVETGTKSAVRSAYILSDQDYTSGATPLVAEDSEGAAQEYWTSGIHNSSSYKTINTSGATDSSGYGNSLHIRPCISLPNNTIVEDDGTLVVVSQDFLQLLPCIKY